MILSKSKILLELNHTIFISPFDEGHLTSNSYDLTLSEHLKVYRENMLDMAKAYNPCDIIIPSDGFILKPNQLYLGSTVEQTCSTKYIPIIEGRSSIARLGLFVHISAGLGEAGFDGHWTLELTCVKPLKIYPKVRICQIYFNEISGEIDYCQSKKYQHSTEAMPSRMYDELKENDTSC